MTTVSCNIPDCGKGRNLLFRSLSKLLRTGSSGRATADGSAAIASGRRSAINNTEAPPFNVIHSIERRFFYKCQTLSVEQSYIVGYNKKWNK